MAIQLLKYQNCSLHFLQLIILMEITGYLWKRGMSLETWHWTAWLITFDNYTTGIDKNLSDGSIPSYCVPNPAKGKVTIEFSLPQDFTGKVDISLLDAANKVLKRFKVPNPVSGRNGMILDIEGMAPGAYIYKIETEKVTTAGRLIIL